MKTILQKKSTKIAIIAILLLLTGGLYLNSQAGNFTWLQNSWIGGQSGTAATHSTDANGTWTNYSAKDNELNINGSGDAELKKADNWQETTDADFNANTSKDSTLAVSGNSIKLLKADGAVCSAAGECQSNNCVGNVCTAASACGTPTVSYGGQTYNTISIGSQCWFKENLNAGTQILNSAVPVDPAPTLNSPSTVSKWCYGDVAANCTTDGGLYNWAEANRLVSACNTTTCSVPSPNQGICPTGWHIPTDTEFKTLEMYLGMTQAEADATGYRGTDQGSKLSMFTLDGNNSSGFSALLAGGRYSTGGFTSRGVYAGLWSASQVSASYAWPRTIFSTSAQVYRVSGGSLKTPAYSVRCIKD